MNKKLTDEQIVKAIENCNNKFDDSCDTCPYREIEPCGKAQMTDCFDLIHRQKAEIERLTRELDDTICMNEMYIEKVKQNSELQKQVDELKLVVKNMEQGYYPVTQLRESMEKEKQQLKDKIAELKSEKQKLLKEMYEQGRFDAIADLDKEGKVVLTKEEKEEYESLIKLLIYDKPMKNRVYEVIKDIKQQTRKKTAEEILTELLDFINGWFEDVENNDFCVELNGISKDLAKQYGVEIKE